MDQKDFIQLDDDVVVRIDSIVGAHVDGHKLTVYTEDHGYEIECESEAHAFAGLETIKEYLNIIEVL